MVEMQNTLHPQAHVSVKSTLCEIVRGTMDTEKMTDQLVASAVDYTIEKISQKTDKLRDKIRHFLGSDIKVYLKKEVNRLLYLKTILHRAEPVFLYDFYIPLLVAKQNVNTSFDSKQFIDMLQSQNIHPVLIAQAGAGKSTFIRDLFYRFIESKLRIPIIIELRYLNNTQDSIQEYILREISGDNGINSRDIMQAEMERGAFAFFFDGFDEISSQRQSAIIADFVNFRRTFSANLFILSSRPYAGAEMLPGFTNFQIKSFTDKQVGEFIDKQLSAQPELAAKMKNSIETLPNNNPVRIFFQNPLLLSLFILTYQSNSQLPTKLFHFYRRVIDTLFIVHDSLSKQGYDREFKSQLSQEQIEEVLKRFAYLTYFQGQISFSRDVINSHFGLIKPKLGLSFSNLDLLKDLQVAAGLWIEENGNFSFAHRSLQEYFLALFITTSDRTNQAILLGKLLARVKSQHPFELVNLLSLVREMAPLLYMQQIVIPILQELEAHLNKHVGKLSTLEDFVTTLNIHDGTNEKGVKTLQLSMGSSHFFSTTQVLAFENPAFSVFMNIFSVFERHKEYLKTLGTTKDSQTTLNFSSMFPEHGKQISWSDPSLDPVAKDPQFLKMIADWRELTKKHLEKTQQMIDTAITADTDLISLI
jgi:hypothetical protein